MKTQIVNIGVRVRELRGLLAVRVQRLVRRRFRQLSGRRIVERIALMEIPPNDAHPEHLQDVCYAMRELAEDWISGER